MLAKNRGFFLFKHKRDQFQNDVNQEKRQILNVATYLSLPPKKEKKVLLKDGGKVNKVKNFGKFLKIIISFNIELFHFSFIKN